MYFASLVDFVEQAKSLCLGICHAGVGEIVGGDAYVISLDPHEDIGSFPMERRRVQRITRWLALSVTNIVGVSEMLVDETEGGIKSARLLTKTHFVNEKMAAMLIEAASAGNQTDYVIDLESGKIIANQIFGNLVDFVAFSTPALMAAITDPKYFDDWNDAKHYISSQEPIAYPEPQFELVIDHQEMRLSFLRLHSLKNIFPTFMSPHHLDPQPDG